MISMDKKYQAVRVLRTFMGGPEYTEHRGPLPARILCVDAPGDKPVVALIDDTMLTRFTLEGERGSALVLVEVSPYADFETDDPVMVGDGGTWKRRYFSHVDGRRLARCFVGGMTSWTTEDTSGWLPCRRPTDEELA